MEFIKSSRGGELLCLNGFILSINYQRATKRYWKCRKGNCKFTAVTEQNQLLSSKGEHDHPPEQAKIEIKKGCGKGQNDLHERTTETSEKGIPRSVR